MLFRKNDDGKIKKLEAELSALYDEYLVYYHGSKEASVAYHTRYIQAISKGINLVDFLNDEILFVRQLIDQSRHISEKEEKEICDRREGVWLLVLLDKSEDAAV